MINIFVCVIPFVRKNKNITSYYIKNRAVIFSIIAILHNSMHQFYASRLPIILVDFFQGLIGWQNADPLAYQTQSLQKDSINLCVVMDKTALHHFCENCNYYIRKDNCSIKTQISHKSDLYLDSGNCFLMTVLNKASPTWEKINCSKPLLIDLFCQLKKDSKSHTTALQIHPDSKSCRKEHILKNNTCYQFAWHTLGKKIQESCSTIRLNSIYIDQFQYLFDAVTDIFPPIFSSNLKHIFTYKRYWNTYSFQFNGQYSERKEFTFVK